MSDTGLSSRDQTAKVTPAKEKTGHRLDAPPEGAQPGRREHTPSGGVWSPPFLVAVALLGVGVVHQLLVMCLHKDAQ